jgi:hypothetical protein
VEDHSSGNPVTKIIVKQYSLLGDVETGPATLMLVRCTQFILQPQTLIHFLKDSANGITWEFDEIHMENYGHLEVVRCIHFSSHLIHICKEKCK